MVSQHVTCIDRESDVRVTCDVGRFSLCADFSLPRLLCSRLRPRGMRQTDRQTSDAHHRLMPPTLGAGHNNPKLGIEMCHSLTDERHNPETAHRAIEAASKLSQYALTLLVWPI